MRRTRHGTPPAKKIAFFCVYSGLPKGHGIFVKEYGKKLPVRLIVADDASDPGKAAAAVERLIKQKK